MFNTYCICLYVKNDSSFYYFIMSGLHVMRKTGSRQSPLVYDLTFHSKLSMNKLTNALPVCFMKFNKDVATIINFVHDAVLVEYLK